MAHRRYFQECDSKTVFNFVSAVLVPILISIFSVILALQQKSIAETNREVDLRIAAGQHRQNVELALDGQRDAKLVAYMNEISHLLLTNNFSLSKRILTSIVRPKTLAVLRQLDVTRKGYLIQFLRDSRMISTFSSSVLSLAGADFNHIDLSEHEKLVDMRQVSFFGASLDDASFTRVSLGYSDFGDCRLHRASFYDAGLNNVNFDSASLEKADFTGADIYGADFTNAKLVDAKITRKQLEKVITVSGAKLSGGSIGRNPNLLSEYNCPKLADGYSIRKNISARRYREWLAIKAQADDLFYSFTGWFDRLESVRVHFIEYNQHGKLVRHYCLGKNESRSQCFASPWTFPPPSSSPSLLNHMNEYQYVSEKLTCYKETYTIDIKVDVGYNGTCRDLYFSIDT